MEESNTIELIRKRAFKQVPVHGDYSILDVYIVRYLGVWYYAIECGETIFVNSTGKCVVQDIHSIEDGARVFSNAPITSVSMLLSIVVNNMKADDDEES